MLSRYRRHAREVEALLFDGSAESAAEISAHFGNVGHDSSRIEVASAFGRVWAGMGNWVLRDVATRRMSVVDDREFRAQYEQIDEPARIGFVARHRPAGETRKAA